jgi:long-subunit acyl-CoA synthetase (AMP-forming)
MYIWYRSVDTTRWIGIIDDDGYVKVVERIEELVINAAGKNMSPSNIENTVKGRVG